MDFVQYIVFAFIGGVILNIMPCVLPVLTLKAFHIVDALRAHPERARIHGLAYALGTCLVFGIFAAFVITLRASGHRLGWGMQFQHPEFVAAIVIALHMFGLNALGVFEVAFGMRAQPTAEGILGSISNGMLAALMSMPCTAPFLGTAAAFAMGSDASATQTFALFMAIGIGLATPFALLSFIPALIRLLPRPGAWMSVFKQLMGFTLIGAAIWLFGSLQTQLTPQSANRVLMFLLVLTVALWAIQLFGSPAHRTQQQWLVRGAGLALCVGFWLSYVTIDLRKSPSDLPPEIRNHTAVVDGHINWAPFSPKLIEAATASGRPVLLDFTADWCAACKTLEATVMNTTAIHTKLINHQVLPVQADYTTVDNTMTKWIEASGRAGIPLVMVIDRNGQKHLMPQVFGIAVLSEALDTYAATGS